MSVKRYVLDENTLMGGMDMFEDDDGYYVLHSDYATIEEERDKLAQEVMRLVNINEQLHERHNALVEAIHKAMDRTADCDKKQTDDQLIADVAYLKRLASDHFKTSIDCGNRVFAVEQKYDALREAVEWHFEILATRPKEIEDYHGFCADEKDIQHYNNQQVEHEILRLCARAEVDRLLEVNNADSENPERICDDLHRHPFNLYAR